MHRHARFALDHPAFNPLKDIVAGHSWLDSARISACLTANIGLE